MLGLGLSRDAVEKKRRGRKIVAVPVATAAYFKMNERD